MHLPANGCIGVEVDTAPNALTQCAHLQNSDAEHGSFWFECITPKL